MTNEEFAKVEKMLHEIWASALVARDAAQKVLDMKQNFMLELTKDQNRSMLEAMKKK